MKMTNGLVLVPVLALVLGTPIPFAEHVVFAAQVEDEGSYDDRLFELEQRIRQLEEVPVRPDVVVGVHGYIDFGFFLPQGDGSGFVQDYGNARFPEYTGKYAWVFLGDILATAVNSRGEAADLGEVPGSNRFDSINSRGAPGFLLSEVNLTTRVGLLETAIVTASVDFVPRTGSEFALGDFFDLDLAQLEWIAASDPSVSVFVGKIEPAFGIEYRQRKANQRFGVTPSLAQRYTSGTQLGLKARGKFLGDLLVFAAAITNGSSTIEQFHFHDEVDSNAGKTLSSRAAVRLPLEAVSDNGEGTLEVGVSGELGPQDRAENNEGDMWFAGADFEYALADLAVRGEWLTGRSPGDALDRVFALKLRSTAYVEFDWMLLPEFGVLLRGDLRDALVTLGDERAYLTKSWRGTVGVRWVYNPNIVVKAEYLHNGEYGGIPQIRNDVVTSSLVVSY